MSLNEINAICSKADMIVGGYAFTKKNDASVHVVQLASPHHALVLSAESEVLETSMDDVELEIVMGYWHKNHKMYLKWSSMSQQGFYKG